jgi:ketosteroid isomerase-like protein
MSETKAELARLLKHAADALRAGGTAGEFSQLLYAPDLLVVGEGWPKAIRGRVEFLPDLTALIEGWGPNADLTFSILDPVFEGGEVATTFVDVYVAPTKPTATAEYYRVVYAWKRTPGGWRVGGEMYTVGTF